MTSKKKQLGRGSGAIRALSRTKVFLIVADLPAAALCKEFLAARLSEENYSAGGGRREALFWPIGPSLRVALWCL
jgi:hypothetical protein